jgi:hypothetical protein
MLVISCDEKQRINANVIIQKSQPTILITHFGTFFSSAFVEGRLSLADAWFVYYDYARSQTALSVKIFLPKKEKVVFGRSAVATSFRPI